VIRSLFFFKLGSVFENAQQLQGLLKSLDKNGDGKITIDDIQLILQGLGLGSVSPCMY
jgi:Ca2+-binding EF-hand superfamily protein